MKYFTNQFLRVFLFLGVVSFFGQSLSARQAAAISSNLYPGTEQVEPHHSKFFRVSGHPTVTVFTPSGNIDVISNPAINGVQVDLYVKRGFSLWAGSRNLDNYRIILQQRGNQIIASVEDKRSRRTGGSGDDIEFTFVVQVPAQASASLRTLKGNLSLEGVKGQHFLQNLSGDLRVKRSDGEIRVVSTSGSIELDGLTGNIYAKTVTGDIHVRENSGEVRVRTTSGDVIAAGISGTLVSATTSGKNEASFKDVAVGIYMESISGDIDLQIPTSLGYTIQARGLNFDFNELGRFVSSQEVMNFRQAVVVINDGGLTVNLSTVSGRVRVRESQ